MGAILAAFFWVKQNDLEKRTKYDFIDYNFAYMEKYEPLLIDAEKTNNWKRFLELTQELIQVQPEYIEQSFKKFKLLDYKQAEIMEFYANMYRMHAAALEKNGRNGEGTLFLERSQILSKLASESKTKFKVMQPTH